jgi:hypothetical protein
MTLLTNVPSKSGNKTESSSVLRMVELTFSIFTAMLTRDAVGCCESPNP